MIPPNEGGVTNKHELAKGEVGSDFCKVGIGKNVDNIHSGSLNMNQNNILIEYLKC
jgi:hypothetical protein